MFTYYTHSSKSFIPRSSSPYLSLSTFFKSSCLINCLSKQESDERKEKDNRTRYNNVELSIEHVWFLLIDGWHGMVKLIREEKFPNELQKPHGKIYTRRAMLKVIYLKSRKRGRHQTRYRYHIFM